MSTFLVDQANAIATEHAAATTAMRSAVAHAIRCGELLNQVKESLPHGEFGSFCSGLPFGATTARGYMRLAALDPADRQRVADLPLRAALQDLRQRNQQISAPEVSACFTASGIGLCIWESEDKSVHLVELIAQTHQPDQAVAYHYTTLTLSAGGDVTCFDSKRPVRMDPRLIIEALGGQPENLRGAQVVRLGHPAALRAA